MNIEGKDIGFMGAECPGAIGPPWNDAEIASGHEWPSFSGCKDHWVCRGDWTDAEGNPTGGYLHDNSTCVADLPAYQTAGLLIRWQDGPVNRDAGEKANGAFVEDVIRGCKERLEFFQTSRFACDENATAIEHLQKAFDALDSRRKDRRERGVEGKLAK